MRSDIPASSYKYYCEEHHRPIDLDNDGCSLDDWGNLHGQALFAKHSKGFLVFIQPDEVEASDEYKESDPYSVELSMEGDFHKRRIDCTLEMVNEAARRVEGGFKILDLGCGQGHITHKIHQAFPEAEVSALDYSISAIEYASDNFPEIDFVVGNAYQCPYAESYFDIVVCNNLWEHVPDPVFLLNRIRRVLKPRGFLIISTPSRYRLQNLVRVLFGKTVNFMSKHHVTEYSVGQVFEQLRYGGFEPIKSFSKPIGRGGVSKKARAAKMLFSMLVSLTASHHQLESTVFYLAQYVPKTDS